MELSKNVEHRLNLLGCFGLRTLTTEEVVERVCTLGERRWFEATNNLIDAARERLLENGSLWQKTRLRENLSD